MNHFIHENNQLFISLKLEKKHGKLHVGWRSGNKILRIFFLKRVLGKEVTRSTRGDRSPLHLLRHTTLHLIFPRPQSGDTFVVKPRFGLQ